MHKRTAHRRYTLRLVAVLLRRTSSCPRGSIVEAPVGHISRRSELPRRASRHAVVVSRDARRGRAESRGGGPARAKAAAMRAVLPIVFNHRRCFCSRHVRASSGSGRRGTPAPRRGRASGRRKGASTRVEDGLCILDARRGTAPPPRRRASKTVQNAAPPAAEAARPSDARASNWGALRQRERSSTCAGPGRPPSAARVEGGPNGARRPPRERTFPVSSVLYGALDPRIIGSVP